MKSRGRKKETVARASEFTDEIFTEICERMSDGKTLRQICKDPQMPHRATVLRWVKNDDARKRQYEFARQAQCDFWADEIVELSRDRSNDTVTDKDGRTSANHAAVQRDRLICDNYKFLMGKLHPGRYGDKTQLELPRSEEPLTIVRWICDPVQGDDGTIINDEQGLRKRIKELERRLAMSGEQVSEPPKLITYDPGPLPSRTEGQILYSIAQAIKRNVPKADQRPPEEVISEVMDEFEKLLQAKYQSNDSLEIEESALAS